MRLWRQISIKLLCHRGWRGKNTALSSWTCQPSSTVIRWNKEDWRLWRKIALKQAWRFATDIDRATVERADTRTRLRNRTRVVEERKEEANSDQEEASVCVYAWKEVRGRKMQSVWGFSTVEMWVIWRNTAESATLPPPLNLIYWIVLQATTERERKGTGEVEGGVEKEEERERRRKWRRWKKGKRAKEAGRWMQARQGEEEEIWRETEEAKKQRGETFIRGDGIKQERKAREIEGKGAGVERGREGGEAMEKAHPLPADCCSRVDCSPRQISEKKGWEILTCPNPSPPCYLFIFFFFLSCSRQLMPSSFFVFTNTNTNCWFERSVCAKDDDCSCDGKLLIFRTTQILMCKAPSVMTCVLQDTPSTL